jgi:uncharacterized paraquat-inducible protein A
MSTLPRPYGPGALEDDAALSCEDFEPDEPSIEEQEASHFCQSCHCWSDELIVGGVCPECLSDVDEDTLP